MAGRSQHPVQIMEIKPFRPERRHRNWRQELAAQPNLASDDRRELETHLRDALRIPARGLNDRILLARAPPRRPAATSLAKNL